MAPSRRALVVGIDAYPHDPLEGCVSDARRFATLLASHADGGPNFDCQLLTDPPADLSVRDLRGAVVELLEQPADMALLYFSGHGTENNLGGYLVTPDADSYNEGLPMSEILSLANLAPIGEVVLILDCCSSGHLGQLPAMANDAAVLREGVSILSASRPSQSAMEDGSGGIFTNLVCDAIAGGAADVLGEVTPAAVYAYVDQVLGPWNQRPLFKSHVARMTSIRNAPPAVPRALLRRLTSLFPGVDEQMPLDPSYEPTAEPPNSEHEEVFAVLQRLRAARLVEPAGEEHMYFAAMNSKACQLTPLGKFYWHLADRQRV